MPPVHDVPASVCTPTFFAAQILRRPDIRRGDYVVAEPVGQRCDDFQVGTAA
jgi:hypothetical protein